MSQKYTSKYLRENAYSSKFKSGMKSVTKMLSHIC